MSYDEQALAGLEGEARAAAFWLGKRIEPVTNYLTAELDSFDLLTADPAVCAYRRNVEDLLAAMSAYCEAAGAYNAQLAANLTHCQTAMQGEATRAAFFKEQFRLTHADLVREQSMSLRQLETFQNLLTARPA